MKRLVGSACRLYFGEGSARSGEPRAFDLEDSSQPGPQRIADKSSGAQGRVSRTFTWRPNHSVRGSGRVMANKSSLTLNLGTNGLKLTSETPPMVGQAGYLQRQDRSAVTHPSKQQPRSMSADV
ncbi:hypothetical protein J6590_017734 [Homalodisca vitripennis]|nr:hypothetical protein J6590_017734 [Homalodisca vitripennis]